MLTTLRLLWQPTHRGRKRSAHIQILLQKLPEPQGSRSLASFPSSPT